MSYVNAHARNLRLPATALAPLLLLCLACSGGSGDVEMTDADAGPAGPDAAAPDESEALFRPDHILEVSITLAPADWAILREQPDVIGMPKTTCGNQPTEGPYDYFPGEITVDGTTVGNVGVRKKGSFGSLTKIRPGLKIKANEYTPGQRISGLKRLTLNNNHQDPTLISQCLGFGLFRDAGLPAPRCSFAHVTVNGEDLGIYSNVETIKQDFLERHFDDASGHLYESGGDFSGNTSGFQPKVDKQTPDCSDLDPVVSAMQSSDADLFAKLGAVVNMDAFMTYWAMEVLTDHWDGYANNRNNYFFYHDPTSDQLYFIPWGIDALFTGRARTTRPSSVFACGSMAWRLYDVPETRALYIAKLRDLMASVWNESSILAEVARMESLLKPFADPTNSGEFTTRLDAVRDFVSTRSGVLLAELDAGTPVWPYPQGSESCLINIGNVSGTFQATWDTLENYAVGSGTTSGSVSGVAVASSNVPSGAGLNEEGKVVVRLLGDLGGGIYAVVYLIVHDPANFVPGTLALDLVNVAAIMSFYDSNTETSYGGGLMLGGSVTFTSAGMGTDAPVVGSFSGEVKEF